MDLHEVYLSESSRNAPGLQNMTIHDFVRKLPDLPVLPDYRIQLLALSTTVSACDFPIHCSLSVAFLETGKASFQPNFPS